MSKRRWARLAAWTIFGTLGCVAISVAYNVYAFLDMDEQAQHQALVSAVLLPVVLAAPLFFLLSLKLRELAVANHRLEVLAATDSLTGLLNRGAFAARAGVLLDPRRQTRRQGTLLVVDADHFKSINDLHGHEAGDEALKLIASAIRASVRSGDVVGRVGGEEFAVLLIGANESNARAVAERIRVGVEQTFFAPGGKRHELSVSVGGASFAAGRTFDALFRAADQMLYEAKRAGRNRVAMTGEGLDPPASASLH